jgi:ribosomal protein S11
MIFIKFKNKNNNKFKKLNIKNNYKYIPNKNSINKNEKRIKKYNALLKNINKKNLFIKLKNNKLIIKKIYYKFKKIKFDFFYRFIRTKFHNRYFGSFDYLIPHKLYQFLIHSRILPHKNPNYIFKNIKKKKFLKKKFNFVPPYLLIQRKNLILQKKEDKEKRLFLKNFFFDKKKFFKRKKYLFKLKKLIYSNFLLDKINIFKKFLNSKQIYTLNDKIKNYKKEKKKRKLLKYILRKKDNNKKYLGSLFFKSYNFYKKYLINDNDPDLIYKKINLDNFYLKVKMPYKIGKLQIIIKSNNIFVNLKNMKNKLLKILSAGLIDFKNSKKKTNFCKEKVIKNIIQKAIILNYKILDVYCNFFSKRLFFHIMKALRESNVFIRFVIIENNNIHGFLRNKKRKRN